MSPAAPAPLREGCHVSGRYVGVAEVGWGSIRKRVGLVDGVTDLNSSASVAVIVGTAVTTMATGLDSAMTTVGT